MALGSPSISDVKNLDVRSISVAISNARQRIEQLERYVQTGTSTTSSSSTSSNVSLAKVLSQLALLQTEVDALGSLLTMIEALPFSSGVDSSAEVPVVMGGVAVRVTAGDIAALAGTNVDLGMLIASLAFSSGVDPGWFVPVEIGGVAVRVTAGDIAALAGASLNVADAGLQLATRSFFPRPVAAAPAPAVVVPGPDDANTQIAMRALLPRAPAPYIPPPATPSLSADDASLTLAQRAYRQRSGELALANSADSSSILANQIFGG